MHASTAGVRAAAPGVGEEPTPVWAWISWPDRPAERIAAFARGWNDRVVNVSWYGPRGEVDCVVWRNAVTHRSAAQAAVEGTR